MIPLAVALILLSGSTNSSAQSVPHWDTQFALPGVSGPVGAIALAEDRYIIGGVFSSAGGVHASNIVSFSPTSNMWSPLGGGVNGQIDAIAVAGGGEIYVGGSFSLAGGEAAANIAMWDGAQWHALADGLDAPVSALALDDGLLYAGGDFLASGSIVLNGIGAWDGTEWKDLDGGLKEDELTLGVYALDVDDEGQLFVGGRFSEAGGVAVNSFAVWNGSEWSSPGQLLSSTENFGVAVYAIACANGATYVGGDFTHAGQLEVSNITRLENGTWSRLDNGLSESVITDIALSEAGDLFVAGSSTLSPTSYLLAAFRGSEWSFIEPPGPQRGAYALAVDESGSLLVGHIDLLDPAGGNPTQFLYRWNTTEKAWQVLGTVLKGVDGPIYAFEPDSSSGFFVAGKFSFAGQSQANNIAYWDGVDWSPLGDGIAGEVRALALAPSGDLYVAGVFRASGDVPARNIARWDGATWHALEDGVLFPAQPDLEEVNTLSVHEDLLIVGGIFTKSGSIDVSHLAAWDINDLGWRDPPGFPNNTVLSSASIDEGLVIAGHFDQLSSEGGFPYVAWWRDGQWETMDEGSSAPVVGLYTAGSALYASGRFGESDVARWDGSQWIPEGVDAHDGIILAASSLSDGRLIIGGNFRELNFAGESIHVDRMAYRLGDRWKPLPGIGVQWGSIREIAEYGDDLIVVGDFGAGGGDGGLPFANFAVLREATALRAPGTGGPRNATESSIYPNPTSGTIIVQLTKPIVGAGNLMIYDLAGREVHRGTPSGLNTKLYYRMPSQIASGTYIIRIVLDGETITELFTFVR